MRVIHHDSRTGTCSALTEQDCGRPDVQTGVLWDDGKTGWVVANTLRPLGPIEEALLDANPELPACGIYSGRALAIHSSMAWLLITETEPWFRRYDAHCATSVWRAECLSEALEACVRIWEQHRVAL
jgi:hypothetical protein